MSGPVDFGSAARDYATHRPPFPASFFAQVALAGEVLDVGAGTGALGRGLAERGCRVAALDISRAMLLEADGIPLRVVGRAEQLPFAGGSFDAVTAGQCWHWFDSGVAAAECWRVLRPGGRVVIAHFSYLPLPGNAAHASEELVLAHHPAWTMAGSPGIHEEARPDLEAAGFVELGSSWYDEDVVLTHAAWRGRMRACNGVIALGDPARIARYDAELDALLRARHPEPLAIPHRIFMLSATKP